MLLHLDFSIINVPICNRVPVKALSPVTVGLPDINTASVQSVLPLEPQVEGNTEAYAPAASPE